jgi:catechol 2,3-dioxygenase-like lactoylglutathione lyase family enzyme
MIRQIAPVFFTTDLPGTVAYYGDKLGFACVGSYGDPPFYGIVARDGHAVHFRSVDAAAVRPEKYEEELLDAYLLVEDVDAVYAEFAAKSVEFARGLGDMPWGLREFVVKDCDGRLLAFGSNI